MTTATATSEPETAQVERRVRSEPRPFDFRRQNKLSREHVRTLQIVQETFCRGFSTMLASHLRTVCHVSIRSIEQHSYDEYVRELPNPTLLTLLSMAPLPGAAILQLPTDIAYLRGRVAARRQGFRRAAGPTVHRSRAAPCCAASSSARSPSSATRSNRSSPPNRP